MGGVCITDEIPRLYETDKVPFEKKTIYQRYRIEPIGFYWLIAELDKEKNLAFGYANLNNDLFAEWGYISIGELLENGAELDRDWKPCTYRDAINRIKKERGESNKL
jgi:hypothetical protein